MSDGSGGLGSNDTVLIQVGPPEILDPEMGRTDRMGRIGRVGRIMRSGSQPSGI